MGVEGAPEGPEDPIAQICVTLGTVRVFRFSKHTRDTRQYAYSFFLSFYRFRGFFFLRRRRSKNAAAEEEEFRRLVVYFASCLFSLSLSTIPCLFRGEHDVVRVFLTFLFYLFDVMRRQTRRCARWERQSWR